MNYWIAIFKHCTLVEAETEEAACEDLAAQVRDNAEASECVADEISKEEYDEEWEKLMEGGE